MVDMNTPTFVSAVVPRAQVIERLDHHLHHGNAPCAIALTDLDGFGELNNRLGRSTGETVLATWERTLATNLPTDAAWFRLGGDEHAVTLPGLTAENALVLLEEIRSHYATRKIDGIDEPLRASVGVAAQPPHGRAADVLLQAAGEALMRAKREGGDRVAIYMEQKMVLKSNYYSRAHLDRLARLSNVTDRTEASLLREALDDLLDKFGPML